LALRWLAGLLRGLDRADDAARAASGRRTSDRPPPNPHDPTAPDLRHAPGD